MRVHHHVHLKLAFVLWGIVGLSLFIVGIAFLTVGESGLDPLRAGLLAAGIALGIAKSRFVLNKIARKNIKRIFTLPQKSHVLSTFSIRSWILVLAMILLGRLIRFLGAPYPVIGVIYVAVGFGLALSSRRYLFDGPSIEQSGEKSGQVAEPKGSP
jgi:hypothetical protein